MATISSNPAPISFSTFPLLAIRAELHLRRLVVIADCFKACRSLAAVAAKTESLPDGFSMGTIRRLPDVPALLDLLRQSFGYKVELFSPPRFRNGPIPGLSDDGLVAAELAREFLAQLDAERGAP